MNFDSSSRDFFSQQRQIQSQLLDESEGPEQDESLIEYRGENDRNEIYKILKPVKEIDLSDISTSIRDEKITKILD